MNLSLRRVEAHAASRRGELVRWTDVVVDEANSVVRLRREMEQTCAAQPDWVTGLWHAHWHLPRWHAV